MADTPYCPLLSINKDVPVMCQEELCMFYVKQLKLCSITVMAYTNALNLQSPGSSPMPQQSPKPTQTASSTQQPLKQPSAEPKKGQTPANPQKSQNPFALDDLD